MKTSVEIKNIAKETIGLELDAISKMKERIGDSFVNAIQLILASKGRLIVRKLTKDKKHIHFLYGRKNKSVPIYFIFLKGDI